MLQHLRRTLFLALAVLALLVLFVPLPPGAE
jgi:hypothetical protein